MVKKSIQEMDLVKPIKKLFLPFVGQRITMYLLCPPRICFESDSYVVNLLVGVKVLISMLLLMMWSIYVEPYLEFHERN